MKNVTVFEFEPENRNDMHIDGFEAGSIWALMSQGFQFEYVVHERNRVQLAKIAEHFGYMHDFQPDPNKVPGFVLMRMAPIPIPSHPAVTNTQKQ